jgi:DNA-binding transcriptional MerR regulator
MARTELVRISTLAERSGVPSATVKHYLREGLLPGPKKRTARNMAYYDAKLVDRIVVIKRLQKEHFLPLGVIKTMLSRGQRPPDHHVAAEAIASVLRKSAGPETRTRAEIVKGGMREEDLDWLTAAGLLGPEGEGDAATYSGDDVELLRTLGASRRAGIDPEMLPFETLETYVRSIRELVRAELNLFRVGVIPRAGEDLERLTRVATTLSERLVVLIRRRMLLPILNELVDEEKAPEHPRKKRKKS